MLQKTNPESFVRAETHRGCFKKLARGLSGGDPQKRLSSKHRECFVRAETHKKGFQTKIARVWSGRGPTENALTTNHESLARAETHRKCFKQKSREKMFKRIRESFVRVETHKRLSNKNRECFVRMGTHKKGIQTKTARVWSGRGPTENALNNKSREFGQGGNPQK